MLNREICDQTFLNEKLLERERLICRAKDFIKMNTKNGQMSTADADYFEENYLRPKKKLDLLIEDEMQKPAPRPPACKLPSNAKILTGDPVTNFYADHGAVYGVNGENYRQNFFNEVRNGCRTAFDTLQESQIDRGGYLLPSEFHEEIISELKSENILRQICNLIQTANDRKLCLVTASPTADFVQEGQEISLSTEQFSQKTLGAYKLAAGISVTNELLADSFYNLEEHLQTEFAKAIASKEEDALLNGSGVNEPYGLLSIIADNAATMTTQTAGTSLAADDVVNLIYSVKRPYRKNAVFLMNDSTIAAIRKLKDADQNYIWAQSLTAGEPNRLLGYPVYSSEYLPNIAGGNIPILFGDFSKFLIGQRGEFSFKPLHEMYALRDLTVYLMIERLDGVLTDSHAIRGLKIKS